MDITETQTNGVINLYKTTTSTAWMLSPTLCLNFRNSKQQKQRSRFCADYVVFVASVTFCCVCRFIYFFT